MWVGGVAAGCAVSCLSPVELIKIQCQRVQGKHMVSPFQMTKKIFTRSGVPGLFRGFFTQLSRDSVGYSCFYLPYTIFGIYLLDKGFEDPTRICIAGAFAGLLSWGVTNPMDVVKTRYQCDLDAKSGRSVLQSLLKTEGLVGFSRGIVANSLRGIPQCGALFLVTAEVKKPNAGCCSKQTVTKTILTGCTGSAKSGEIMAIMGSSGAGKSTFMNALTHRNVETLSIKGSINIAGAPIKDQISKISAYIQQDDHFVGALTVREHLNFHADLRLSKESAEMRKETVDRILRIIRRIPADHFIREISKFKDLETGTSDKDANEVRIGQICDKYKESKYAMAMENQLITDGSDNYVKQMIKASKEFRPNPFYAFWKVLIRGMIAQYRDKTLVVIKIMQNLVVALVIGLIYLRPARPGVSTSNPTIQPYDSKDVFNSNGALFAYVCSFSFNYMFLVVFTFPRMAIILRREYYSGLYQLWTAIMADMLALVPFTILMPLAYTAITYYMVGLNPAAGSFFLQWLTLFQIAFCATGYGYLISALSPSVEAANAIASPMMLPMLIFGGFFLQSDTVPKYFIWIKYLSWFYYGSENLYSGQWENLGYCNTEFVNTNDANNVVRSSNEKCEEFYPPGTKYLSGETILNRFGYNPDNIERNIGIMFALAIGFRLIGYLILSLKYRSKA
ncbi:Oidioi.mRNA.OKI2018_I69.PAR.g10988.t1.cds [Oikopleura dioica]|uniref:Oidioi.mRNA.OKI2018_I69.PAR.g10988.t1.cds n=1 Tax=Oikopleura dioica TaxID=34765 RepID=A0ABN7RTF6_OIKDI|nr:Oidioi.mRNA.OKI2018_I69.PAR.g10988.t1.cds [Oikopleura dioica]